MSRNGFEVLIVISTIRVGRTVKSVWDKAQRLRDRSSSLPTSVKSFGNIAGTSHGKRSDDLAANRLFLPKQTKYKIQVQQRLIELPSDQADQCRTGHVTVPRAISSRHCGGGGSRQSSGPVEASVNHGNSKEMRTSRWFHQALAQFNEQQCIENLRDPERVSNWSRQRLHPTQLQGALSKKLHNVRS